MLNLSELNFQVNTAKLKEAHDLIQGLVPAMQGVANASGKMAKDTTQAAKATEEVGKSAERADKKLAGVERTLQRQALKNSILRGEIVQLKDAQVSLDKVFTSGQAGMLASLQMAGATAEEYKKLASSFKDFNQITGANKFDDSVNGLTKLRKEVQELTLVQKLQAEGYQLTAKEVRDLARDEELLKQSKEKKQLTEGQYAAKIAETRQEYIRLSAEKAKFIQQSKLAEEQIKREAQAQARSASMMGEDAVRLFRENEATKKAKIDAEIQAEKQLAPIRKAAWREYAQQVGRDSDEILAMRKHYAEQEKTAAINAAANDKQLATLRKGYWKEWANSVGKDVEANRNTWREYYKSVEQDAKRAESAQAAATNRALALAKSAGNTLAMIGRSGQIYAGAGKVASAEQPMDKAMALFYKEQERNAKASAKANQYLATEMQRVDSILAELNREHTDGSMLSERHAASIARFSNQLKMAGVSGTQATAQLEGYRQKMQQIEALENKRAQNRLANALAPQISDVAVSLAGGMPLHLVIMQQGLQIRDLIGQSGVAAEHLQKTMREAMKNMVTSIGGTVAALAQMTGGALMDAGRGIADFGLKASGATAMLDRFAAKNAEVAAGLNIFRSAIAGIAGVMTGGLIVVLAAATYEYIKLIGANNDLARSLASTQYVFGVGVNGARAYASALGEMGVSTRDSLSIMTAMSETSKLTSADILLVGKSAQQMEKWAGVAIEDTVKAFNKMKEEPVKALTELAMKTGQVTPELIKMVRELERQGRTADASAIAMKALADQHSVQVKRMQQDLHPLTRAWIGFKEVVSGVWSGVGQIINESMGAVPEQQKLLTDLNNLQRNFKFSKGTGVALPNFEGRTFEQEQSRITSRLAGLRRENELRLVAADLNRKQNIEDEKRRDAESKYATKAEQKAKALADLELNRSRISAAAYEESKKRIEEQFADKGAAAEVNKQLTYRTGITEKLNDAFVKMTKTSEGYNEVQTALLDIFDDPRFAKMSDMQKIALREQAEALLELTGAERKLTEEEKEANKVREKTVELRNKQVEAANKLAQATNQSIVDLDRKKEDVAFEASLFGVRPELERQLRAEYELKRRFETAGLDFQKSAEEARNVLGGEMLDEELQRLGVRYQKSVELAEMEKQNKIRVLTDMEKRQQAFDDIAKRGFEQMGDALIDFAITGKSSFGDMIQSMLVDLAKLEMRMQMMKWYESMGGGSGGGGILSGLLGMFTGTTQAKGGAWSNGVQMFAKGGVVNRTTAFGMRGGLGIMGEAGPEAIMPLKRGRDGSLGVASAGGSNVQVVVNNYSGAQVKQQETVDSRGNRKVEVVVGEMASGEVQRSGSAMQRGIGSTFGMRPALIAR